MEVLLPREWPPRRAPGAGGRREGLRWRRLARQLAQSGRLREAADVQQALVSSRLSGGPRARLRDRFRLLRCQLALGHWSDALANIEVLYGSLARRGILGGVAAGWVFLARAAAHFHLGHGARFRRSLATVLRGVRRGPARALRLAAYRLAAADAHLARGPESSISARERAWDARVFRAAEAQESPRRTAEAAAEATWPAAVFAGFTDAVPARPPASRGCPAAAPADPWSRWLTAGAGAAGRPPLQLLPELARLAEERVAEASPEERRRIHAALARDAAAVREPWVKACVLEALAEAALWLPSAGNGDGTTALLLQARTDLGLAAGLFRRMEWPERAARCEERWARLALPALGAGVCERTAAAHERASARAVDPPGTLAEAVPARRLHPERVRVVLQEAGFATADRRVLQELAPLLLLAPSPLPVLILGESGTGKEVLARAVHRWSRLRGEFVPIHCGAIPRDLLESELFGHTRGAFTGASGDKPGLIEAAGGGTLFLDEIGEMGPDAQMKMLRVLESGEVRRLGDLAARRASIRLVAATHRDLEAEVAAGRFRLDLFHRIRGVVVRLRPLRERRGDIPLLAARVLAQGGPPLGLSTEAMTQLLACEWPGNVRELKAVLARAAHLARALGLRSVPAEFLRFDCAPLGGSGWFSPEAESTVAPADVAVAGSRPEGIGSGGAASSVDPRGAEGGSCGFGGSGAQDAGGAGGVASGRSDPAGGIAAAAGMSSDRMDEAGLPRGGLEAYLAELERHFIVRALEEHGWNRTRAARSLGDMSRTTLLSKMKRLGIEAAAGEDEGDSIASPADPSGNGRGDGKPG